MSAHTPGPWFVMDTKGAFGQSVGLAIVSEHVDDAIVASVGGDLPGEKANAHLIAAAPDLLRACKQWLARFDGERDRECAASIVENIRAAVQKAEGR